MTLTIVETRAITGGVDTHADVHVAAALDPIGGLLGVGEFPATPAGYARLLDLLGGVGTLFLGRVRGTRSHGPGPAPPPPPARGPGVGVDPSGRAGPPPAGPTRPLRTPRRAP